MSSALTLVTSLVSESEQILSLVETEQWDAFFDQEQLRQNRIKQLDLRNVDISVQQTLDLRSQMQKLMTLNDQIETVCREKRGEVVAELQKLKQGSRAKKAYS